MQFVDQSSYVIKKSLQCPHCLQWITISHGGFKKHIRSCQTTSIHGNNSCTEGMAPIWNPLLSCSIDTERDTMYNQVKTIQRILLITKLIVRIYFMKGMMILTILWITKLMVRISTMKEMGPSVLHNVYQFLNKEVMRVYTNSKLCYWTLFINTRQA